MKPVEISVRFVETPIPYATSGLIAMWDVAWNRRCCLHDPEYGRLAELCHTGNDLIINSEFGELHGNFLHCSGLGIAAVGSAEIPTFDRQQIEIVFQYIAKGTTPNNYNIFDLYKGVPYVEGRFRRRFSLYVRDNNFLGFSSRRGTNLAPYAGRINSVSVLCDITKSDEANKEEGFATTLYANGDSPIELVRLPGCSTSPIMPTLGASAECDIYSIRVYNRPLSIDEINHNYNIDKERFGL